MTLFMTNNATDGRSSSNFALRSAVTSHFTDARSARHTAMNAAHTKILQFIRLQQLCNTPRHLQESQPVILSAFPAAVDHKLPLLLYHCLLFACNFICFALENPLCSQ